MLSTGSVAFAGGLDCRTGVDHKHPACYTNVGYNGHHGHRHGHRHGHYGHNHMWWVAPAVVGVIGYELGRQQNSVVIQQQNLPTVITPQCSPWTQVQNPDGTITTTRICTQ